MYFERHSLTMLFSVTYKCSYTTSCFAVLTSHHFHDNLEVAHALLNLGKSLAYLTSFVLVRYHGDNSTITCVVIASVVIAALCHVILELRLRHTASREQSTSAAGAYVLLDQQPGRWLPQVDPKKVAKQTTRLMNRIPEVERTRAAVTSEESEEELG